MSVGGKTLNRHVGARIMGAVRWPRWLGPSGASAAVSGLALAGGLAVPGRAVARDWRPGGDAGIYVGYRFGGVDRGRFAVGLEARGLMIDRNHDCDGNHQVFGGAVARLEVDGGTQNRLTLGPTLGTTNGMTGYAFEAAGGFVFGAAPGPVALVSAEGMAAELLDARIAYSIGRDWLVAGGVRFPPLTYAAFCGTGRRLRREDGPARLAGAVIGTGGRCPGELDLESLPESSVRAAQVWTHRACLEWASVPAFCEVAAQLRACHAPADLVARARDAATDELRHAVLSAGLARDLAGTEAISLDPAAADRRAPAVGRGGLVRLAVESFVDGCVSESAAAALAADEAAGAGDLAVGRLQRAIAADEARHAELAWAIVEWAAATDPQGVRPALQAAMSAGLGDPHARREPDSLARSALASLAPFGILDARHAGEVHLREGQRARQRLRAQLAR